MNKENRKILILSICILIILGLIVSVGIKEGQSSCDECKIKFTTERQSGRQLEQPIVMEIPSNELYTKLIEEGICTVYFDRTMGYVKNG